MHRDVKPLNLFWNRATQSMKLGDLGQTVYVQIEPGKERGFA